MAQECFANLGIVGGTPPFTRPLWQPPSASTSSGVDAMGGASHSEQRDPGPLSVTQTRFPSVCGRTRYSISSSKLEPLCTSIGTNPHTCSSFMATPPPQAFAVTFGQATIPLRLAMGV